MCSLDGLLASSEIDRERRQIEPAD